MYTYPGTFIIVNLSLTSDQVCITTNILDKYSCNFSFNNSLIHQYGDLKQGCVY